MNPTLSAEQLLAVTAPLNPSLVQAGAGTGKTFVMAERVKWLRDAHEFGPDSILGLTFTNKAASELAERVNGLAVVLTYNAFAQRVVSEYGVLIGIEPHTFVLTDAARYQLAAKVALKSDLPFETTDLSKRQVVNGLIGLDDTLSNHGVSTAAVREHDELVVRTLSRQAKITQPVQKFIDTAKARIMLSELVDDFRSAKREAEVIDFADQVRLAQEIAAANPMVARNLKETYQVVLLDEYQDTSVSQRKLLTLCFGEQHPVTAVGDPLQSIYEWRAASVANLTEFPKHFAGANGEPARRFAISVNFRSGQKILDAANHLGEPLRGVAEESVRLVATPENEQSGEIAVGLFETWPEELKWVVGQVKAQLAQGVAPSEIAILLRRRSEIGDVLVALAKEGVPAAIAGSSELIDLPEVAELIAMLSVIEDPSDNAAVLRLLGGPRWGLGIRDLALLGQRASDLVSKKREPEALTLISELAEAIADRDPSDLTSLMDALADPGDLAYGQGVIEKCLAFSAELTKLRKRANDSLSHLLTAVMESTGYDIELRADPDSYALRKYENVMAFRNLVEDFTSLDGESSLRGLLAWLDAADEWGEPARISLPSLPNSVSVMTVHSAKGLEREVVFVPALAGGVFPSGRSRSRWTTNPGEIAHELRGDAGSLPPDPNWREDLKKKQLDAFDDAIKQQVLLEERRLAYVAVTRAKKTLFATGHIWGSRKKPHPVSTFLTELREAAEAGAGQVVTWFEMPTHDAVNPLSAAPSPVYWPISADQNKKARLIQAAALVKNAKPDISSLSNVFAKLAHEIITEARTGLATKRTVALPTTLSVSEVAALSRDATAFAADLYRPMPTAPTTASRRGTAFHEWVEEHFQTSALVDPTDLPGAADQSLTTDDALELVKQGFLSSRWAELSPVALEWDFVLPITGRAIAGRADAVFLIDGVYTIVDWKTGSAEFVDPVQLSLYRHAWARSHGLLAENVQAMFVFLPSGEELTPDGLLTVEQVGELLGAAS